MENYWTLSLAIVFLLFQLRSDCRFEHQFAEVDVVKMEQVIDDVSRTWQALKGCDILVQLYIREHSWKI